MATGTGSAQCPGGIPWGEQSESSLSPQVYGRGKVQPLAGNVLMDAVHGTGGFTVPRSMFLESSGTLNQPWTRLLVD